MREEVKKLKKLIEDSNNVLITSHISPDADAVASLLLCGATLETNFKAKRISCVLEEEPLDLEFLYGYEKIQFQPLIQVLESKSPELIILLDGNNFSRFSRLDSKAVRRFVHENNIKVATIDHHELADKDSADVFINLMQPATVQTVYELLFKEMSLSKPPQAAHTALAGFYADTGGFTYLKAGQSRTVFGFAEQLVGEGADIESVKSNLNRYTEADMRALAELTANVSHENDYTFSFMSDTFIDSWLADGNSQARLQKATGLFLDEFIRNIDARNWGFITYKNTLQGKGIYSVSFRATGGTRDVSTIANTLGGGGHKPAAGAKFSASSIEDAISKVKQVIENTA